MPTEIVTLDMKNKQNKKPSCKKNKKKSLEPFSRKTAD